MKFGESLSEGLVTEWKNQYVNYKNGKKFIKKIKALKANVQQLERETTDRTPLLIPNGPGGNKSVDTDNNIFVDSNVGQSSPDESPEYESLKKTSAFGYSLKSSRDKEEDYQEAKDNFFKWLDSEYNKVNLFFQEREQQAYERFLIIQDQLEQLKDHRRLYLQRRALHSNTSHSSNDHVAVYYRMNDIAYRTKSIFGWLARFDLPTLPSTAFMKKWRKKRNRSIPIDNYDMYDANYFQNRIRNGSSGDSDDISSNASTLNNRANEESAYRVEQNASQLHQRRRRDYTSSDYNVPYLYARKQLKQAMLEFYRALSLLKSYKTLNRTAFRKITKKFDKALGTSISADYMKKVDDESYFQTSDLLDKIVTNLEELYIETFDPQSQDKKVSLEKLKSIAYALSNNTIRAPTHYIPFFFSGLFIGFAIPLFCLALYVALNKIINGVYSEGLFMLQIYGGFFLMNFMVLLFGVNLFVFEYFKINYKFIFEFNMSTALDTQQFWLLPSFGFALLALIMWFSFNNFWPIEFPGRDWPWIYFGVMLSIFFWPGPQLYGPSRKWLQVALWRLMLSGLYPVEFRDFFLGDMLCSLTYTMGNISFFFCLYSHHWSGLIGDHPLPSGIRCGSAKSRLMGFFGTLPSIFRFLQCVRRYADTGDWFPHLANMLKYSITTLYYCLLSVYRIERSQNNRIAFIIFAAINSLYSSIWDVTMDWSLGQSGSKYLFLRDNLVYKNPTYYYIAIICDVTLRFQWVFYACFSNQVQQLAVTSFCIAVAELIRRFIWVFFRMENEHCTNVILFRASRDSPLPYKISSKVEYAIKKLVQLHYAAHGVDLGDQTFAEDVSYVNGPPSSMGGKTSFTDEEAMGGTPDSHNLRNRRKFTFTNFTNMLNLAHVKDFQRKKAVIEHDSDDDDDDDDDVASSPQS